MVASPHTPSLTQQPRGNVIERMLGGMCNNFPTIDKFVKGANDIATSITSIKSMDLSAKSYQTGNTIYNTLMRYGRSLANFSTTTHNLTTVNVDSATQRILELAIPTGATQAQMDQIFKAAAELFKQGIELVVHVIR